ncbi:hypothetical protein Bca52824_075215 [Brassica carinata]|uniref:Uncharacterized protein n=1 Tax=Brassica carinata TaxID=52824 RepID=A0A8X7TXR3_BRACI|nr:hypothetical protein Bca52824_075215 [Brassica carinata]
MVLVASNIVISSRFSVTTAHVLSSTYPPPLLAVKKSSPPSTLPEAISNRWRSPLLSLSKTAIYLLRQIFNVVSLCRRPAYHRGSIPFRDSQASNLWIYVLHDKSSVISVSTHVSRLSSWPVRVTNSSHRPSQPSLASSQVFMPPAIHLTSRRLQPTKVSMELSYIVQIAVS